MDADDVIHCSYIECKETIPNNYWGKVKSDWFFDKAGNKFCPKHTPDWVAGWKARKAISQMKEKK